jgi:hypothetical protein
MIENEYFKFKFRLFKFSNIVTTLPNFAATISSILLNLRNLKI